MCDHVCPEHPRIVFSQIFPAAAAGCAGGMLPQVIYPGTAMPAATFYPLPGAAGCAPPAQFFEVASG